MTAAAQHARRAGTAARPPRGHGRVPEAITDSPWFPPNWRRY